MKRYSKPALAALLMAWPALTAGLAADHAAPTITLRVVNVAKAAQRNVLHAETVATWILGRAGVKAVWLNCPMVESGEDLNCSPAAGPSGFWVRIVADAPRDRSRTALGWATLDGSSGSGDLVTVSYAMVSAIAEASRVDVSEILGAAMAHEIGHLLLGAGHSPDGVMAAVWDDGHFRRLATGRLDFTSEQAARMRSAIAGRATGTAVALAAE